MVFVMSLKLQDVPIALHATTAATRQTMTALASMLMPDTTATEIAWWTRTATRFVIKTKSRAARTTVLATMIQPLLTWVIAPMPMRVTTATATV